MKELRAFELWEGGHQAHHVPKHLQNSVQVEVLSAGDGDAVGLLRDGFHLFQAAHVDFVVDVEALDVPPIALRTAVRSPGFCSFQAHPIDPKLGLSNILLHMSPVSDR